MTILQWKWIIMTALGLILLVVSPLSTKLKDFYQGSKNEAQPNTLILTSSLVISWLFAKSITNAADLGYEFGMMGGLAYAGYYLSFFVAGLVIYKMRTKGGFSSIHEFIEGKFGKAAVLVFTILIGFRLFNEVWSNSIVIGTYFGESGSVGYYGSILIFTGLTLAYTVKGGMRSSILTDLIQFVLFGVLLFFILGLVIPATPGGAAKLVATGEWSLAQGGNLLLVAILQSLSYPFHDPVMTDRGFISSPKTSLKAFIWAGVFGGLCILLFSFVGIFGKINGESSPVIAQVSSFFGIGMMLMISLIMLTSAASTIDSTLSSATKLVQIDLLKSKNLTISKGRLTMLIVTLIGTLPVFLNPAILSATTISGTMVLGLAPIFIFWNIEVPKASFFLPILGGVFVGSWLLFFPVPQKLLFTNGKYSDLLSLNVLGSLLVFILFFAPLLLSKLESKK